jgi:hypothetical protein
VSAAASRSWPCDSSASKAIAPVGMSAAAPETITCASDGSLRRSGANAGSSGAETTSARARLSRSM